MARGGAGGALDTVVHSPSTERCGAARGRAGQSGAPPSGQWRPAQRLGGAEWSTERVSLHRAAPAWAAACSRGHSSSSASARRPATAAMASGQGLPPRRAAARGPAARPSGHSDGAPGGPVGPAAGPAGLARVAWSSAAWARRSDALCWQRCRARNQSFPEKYCLEKIPTNSSLFSGENFRK